MQLKSIKLTEKRSRMQNKYSASFPAQARINFVDQTTLANQL